MNVSLKLIVSMFLAMLLAILGACAAPKVPQGEAPKGDIIIGILDDFSGPTAGTCTPYKDAEDDLIKYINEKGGIQGHPIKATVVDFKMDSTLAISGWDRLKAEGVPIIMSVMSAAAPVLQNAAQKDQIPVVGGGGTMDLFFPKTPSFYFADSPQFYGIWDSLANVIQKDWAAKGKQGVPKVAFDVVQAGRYPTMYGKASKLVCDKRGWPFIVTKSSIAPADVTTQALQVKDFGADYIYLMGTDTAGIAWLKELKRQNLQLTVFGSHALGSAELWQAVGNLAQGMTVYQFSVQWTDTDIPMVKQAHELNAKYHPTITSRPGHYFRGFADFQAIAEALDRAIKKVGYENLNGSVMRDAMETIKDFEPMEMGIGYTWTATDHQGLHGVRWYTWTENGTMKAVTDWDIFAPLPEEQRSDTWWLTN